MAFIVFKRVGAAFLTTQRPHTFLFPSQRPDNVKSIMLHSNPELEKKQET
jgi:hypothetical protein